MRSMSDSEIPCQPRIDEPSKPSPSSKADSSNARDRQAHVLPGAEQVAELQVDHGGAGSRPPTRAPHARRGVPRFRSSGTAAPRAPTSPSPSLGPTKKPQGSSEPRGHIASAEVDLRPRPSPTVVTSADGRNVAAPRGRWYRGRLCSSPCDERCPVERRCRGWKSSGCTPSRVAGLARLSARTCVEVDRVRSRRYRGRPDVPPL